MEINKGDIVLVTFPFTNLEATKLRPALVIATYKNDVILFPITTKKTGLFIEVDKFKLASGELLTISYVKLNLIFTINKKLVYKGLAKVTDTFMNELLKKFITDVLKIT